MSYLRDHVATPTPQSEPLAGQIENSAGGHAWDVGPLVQLRRWLILGSEGGSFYAGQRKLTGENVASLDLALSQDARAALDLIADVSRNGRAPRNDQAVFALAYAVAWGKNGRPEIRDYALALLPDVCRTATHLFQFVGYLDAWGKASGRSVRRALARWYNELAPADLALQLVKYRNREGWTHRDVLRLAHPVKAEPNDKLVEWAAHPERFAFASLPGGAPIGIRTDKVGASFDRAGIQHTRAVPAGLGDLIDGFMAAQQSGTPTRTRDLIWAQGLPREAVNPEHLTDKGVWEALLLARGGMPITALVRNLATMTRVGLLDGLTDATHKVVERLHDPERIRKSRIHPLTLLVASRTYASGRGDRGGNRWTPIPQIVDALDHAFYLAFDNVEPTGVPHLIAVDVSGSMGAPVAGMPLTCYEAAAAMALVIANVEPLHKIVAFSAPGSKLGGPQPTSQAMLGGRWGGGDPGLTELPITPRMRLSDVLDLMRSVPMGGTDCSLPMRRALTYGWRAGLFAVITDNETWAGDIHPADALRTYRRETGIDARLAVLAMVPNRFSIADPEDAGMADFVGFDTATPQLLADFAAGRL